MSVAQDIVASYTKPRAVFRRRAGAETREDRALVVLMAACLLIFVAQWPRLARISFTTGDELNPLLGGALFGWLFIAPLVLYAIGTLSHILARLMGGKGNAYRARFALFWALLAASPLWLLWGIIAGYIGQSTGLSILGMIALGAFIMIWAMGFLEAEWGEDTA